MKPLVTSKGNQIKAPFKKIYIVVLVVFVITIILSSFIPINFATINLPELSVIFKSLFSPKGQRSWSDYFGYTAKLVTPLLDTIKMSLGGTLLGCLIAIPFAIISARNIIKHPFYRAIVKTIMNLIRTLPAMVLAVIATMFVGLGLLSGLIAITIFSFGVMTKMLYEAIETVDMNPFQALEATGANKLVAFRYAILPQILPIILSYTIYIFEMNIRASAVLGYVGAGGIGAVIKDNILYNYDRVGMAIIVILVVTVAIQLLSSYLRRKLQ